MCVLLLLFLRDRDERSEGTSAELLRLLAFVHLESMPILPAVRVQRRFKKISASEQATLNYSIGEEHTWYVAQLPYYLQDISDAG
jgi:hypothetical protein